MSQEFNIIGDIAGNYETLLALIEKMPKTATVVSVGDMVDRGPKSNEVIEFFASGKGLAVLGNHEHMMLDALKHPVPYNGTNPRPYYGYGVWFMNGGEETAAAYMGKRGPQDLEQCLMELIPYVPQKHLDFLNNAPLYLEFKGDTDDLIISHAPINPSMPFANILDLGDSAYSRRCEVSIIWNRGTPRRIDGKFQVYGHNSYRQPAWHWDQQGKWGVCIDTCRGKKLSGIHWPSLEVFEQDFIDFKKED